MNKARNNSQFSEYCAENNVTQIVSDNLYSHPKLTKKVRPIVTRMNIDENDVYELYIDSFSEFFNDGQQKIIRDFKINKYQIIATLDLHNYNQNQSIQKLNQFINNHPTYGNTCLKIIHGKGLNSNENKPVLKHTVRRILEHHPRLLAYSSGSISQGGDGITLVKFKNK